MNKFMFEGKDLSFMTTDEIANLLKVTEKTVRLFIKEGAIKAFRVGGQYRVRQEDFETYLKSVYIE